MNYYFFDSSGIVKNYVVETGTNWVKNIFNSLGTSVVYAVATAEVEVVSAFARRLKGRTLTATQASVASTQFKYDFGNDMRVIAVESALLNRAVNLAEKYALRGFDAVQLSAAVEVANFINASKLGLFIFVSADNELNAAAQVEGLAVENPNNYP